MSEHAFDPPPPYQLDEAEQAAADARETASISESLDRRVAETIRRHLPADDGNKGPPHLAQNLTGATDVPLHDLYTAQPTPSLPPSYPRSSLSRQISVQSVGSAGSVGSKDSLDSGRSMLSAYEPEDPMIAAPKRTPGRHTRKKTPGNGPHSTTGPRFGQGCCFSQTGGCCFSDTDGCCFSQTGGCCFSDTGGCCCSSSGGCCFSANGGFFFSNYGGMCFSQGK